MAMVASGRAPGAVRRSTPARRPVHDAHAVPTEAVLAHLHSSPDGLTAAEAAARLEHYGPNALPEPSPSSFWRTVLRQFASPLIYALLLAAVLSAYLREWADAGFIAAVLLINAGIGAVQEHQAARSAQALRSMVPGRARVLRDGEVLDLQATELVPGDVVFLASGDRVPADLRLIDSRGLAVDESALTGESVPVAKTALAELEPATLVADRVTMVHAGTLTSSGRGRGVVVATGPSTELGQLAGSLARPREAEPPLLTRMRQFTVVVAAVIGAVAVLAAGIELARGAQLQDVLLLAVALGVSAIPEGLPVAITVALAIAMSRMARRAVIVRRLVAVETLGSCTVVASDKTGTLTRNELTVERLALPGLEPATVTGSGSEPEGLVLLPTGDDPDDMRWAERAAEAAVLCNEATLARREDGWVHSGDPVDVALLVLARKLGLAKPEVDRRWPRASELPFESERRFAASVHARPGEPGRPGQPPPDADGSSEPVARVVVKGALERVLPMCQWASGPQGDVPVDRHWAAATADTLAREGYRVLALASGPWGDPDHVVEEDDITELTLLGLVGMVDPPRPTAGHAVQSCTRAGIRVVMVTGDHPRTALTVARELGIAESAEQVVTGAALHEAEALGPSALDELTGPARVFARVEPEQKLTIVESLRRAGHVVAVTGDGANDAPALRHAHVGVAMGRSGTDVAREAADLLVTDDDFSSIVAGVEEGRVAYANVRKVIALLVATGAAELVLVLLALAFGLPLPLLAVQLLWLNLVTNGIQDVALGFEPAEGDEMARRPRPPSERIFNRLMIERVALSALVMGGTAFLVFRVLLAAGWPLAEVRNTVMLLMVLFENVFVFAVRSERRSAFARRHARNRILIIGTLMAQLVHIGAMHFGPTADVLGLNPVSFTEWAALLGLALLLLVAVEAHKAIWRWRAGRVGARA